MNTKTILLLEDVDIVVESIERALARHNFVTKVLGSQAAFDRWLSAPDWIPAAAVFDVWVKTGDGREAEIRQSDEIRGGIRCAECFQRKFPHIPVVLYSHYTQEQANYTGDIPFLQKRAEHKLLCERLKSLLDMNYFHAGVVH